MTHHAIQFAHEKVVLAHENVCQSEMYFDHENMC